MNYKINTGVILAAGQGNRLNALGVPKPLVLVGDQTLIDRNIGQLSGAGVQEIYLVLGHQKQEIKKRVFGDHHPQVDLRFVEPTEAGQGDILFSVLALRGKIKEPFIMTVADLFSEKNPYTLLTDGEGLDEYPLIPLVETNRQIGGDSGANSRVVLDGQMVTALGNNLETSNGWETGIYLFGVGALDLIEECVRERGCSTFVEVLQLLAQDHRLRAVVIDGVVGRWFDVNTPATQIKAEILSQSIFQERKEGKGEEKENSAVRPLQPVEVFGSFARARHMETKLTIGRGFLDSLGDLSLVDGQARLSNHILLTDGNVDHYHGDRVEKQLYRAGLTCHKIVIPAGENSKNMEMYSRLCDQILSRRVDKHSYIFSLGGGVINNIAGFLASTLYRGINLIHIPTSLLAQVDAAIDFKQAIDSPKGKNLIGSYYPARWIVIDPNVLSTLELRYIRDGLAEVIKHALAQDRDFFEWLANYHGEITDLDFLDRVVKQTVRLKLITLNNDPDDDYNEMMPQYGHSVGHAIEHLSSYNLMHGESIAIGQCVQAEISHLFGVCDQETVLAHYEILSQYGLPVIIPDNIKDEDILNTVRFDKHFVNSCPHMVLVSQIGEVWQHARGTSVPVDMHIVAAALVKNRARGEELKHQYGR